MRADDDFVAIFLETKQVAQHRRAAGTSGKDIKHPSHEQGLLEQKPAGRQRTRCPRPSSRLGETGDTPTSRSSPPMAPVRSSKETIRLTFLVELFGAGATASAIEEVMQTGHVGAEYVEYVCATSAGSSRSPPPFAWATRSSMPSPCPSPTSPSTTGSRRP